MTVTWSGSSWWWRNLRLKWWITVKARPNSVMAKLFVSRPYSRHPHYYVDTLISWWLSFHKHVFDDDRCHFFSFAIVHRLAPIECKCESAGVCEPWSACVWPLVTLYATSICTAANSHRFSSQSLRKVKPLEASYDGGRDVPRANERSFFYAISMQLGCDET